FLLSACSGITINIDNIFPAETLTEESTDDTTAGAADTSAADTTAADTIKTYEYTGYSRASEYLENLGEYSFDGESLFIKSTTEDAVNLIFISATDDGDGSSTYSEALYERTLMVEEKLLCELHYVVTTAEEMETELAAALDDGSYYSNLLLLSQSELETFAVGGYLCSLYSLPFFDVEEDYILTDATLQLAAGYDLYGMVSWATADPDDIPCVFVNTALLPDTDTSVETTVKRGEWTWDKLLTLGNLTWGTDSNEDSTDIITASLGLHFVLNEERTVPTVTLPEGAADAAALTYQISKSGSLSSGTLDDFIAGGSAFYVGTLGDMNSLALTGVEWTVVPIPKYSESQSSYYSLVSGGAVLAVPANITDYTGASYLIRALAAASCGYLRDSYVQYHMYSTVRSESALDMIEIIYDSVFYDFSFSLGYGSKSVSEATYGLIHEAIADTEETDSDDDTFDLDIEALFEDHRGNADYILAERYPLPNE
ncbi:MAG: hypothetical protein LUH54_04545, partial [Firmicutes bacterium]|nr:hypothetical protein [Bacillota bacterium]